MKHPLAPYLREEVLPGPFCPGCGNGLVLGAFLRAVARAGYASLREFVFVSGIGCAAWIPSPHLKADTLHVAHGRAIPTAIGVKLHRPELQVVVVGGDGDLAGIGGHLVHAARRNADLLVLMVNNLVYGMTGGRSARPRPTASPPRPPPTGTRSGPWTRRRWSPPRGQLRRPVDRRPRQGPRGGDPDCLGPAGFRFVEALSPCPGRLGEGSSWSQPPPPLAPGPGGPWDEAVGTLGERFPVGVYADRDEPGLVEVLRGQRVRR